MKESKEAVTDYPVHELISRRWSPTGFDEKTVSTEDLGALFEAARWAPSCFNEQPWNYVVARKEQPEEFSRLLSCLAPKNQEWARFAPVLALGVISLKFSRNGTPNRHAAHDLGQASAQLSLEATARGLSIHQMAGILPDRARELYSIPEDHEVMTALAIGYQAGAEGVDPSFVARDLAPRHRKPMSDFLFESTWGASATFLD